MLERVGSCLVHVESESPPGQPWGPRPPHDVLDRWLGWSGTVAGVLAVAAGVAGTADPLLHVPWPSFTALIWTLVVSHCC
jgi:hypothetical protein